MVRNQDESSFMSWTATLHPESAVSSTDPRLQTSGPWATVYNETCGGADNENVPIAIQVVPLDIDNQAHPQQEQGNRYDPESQLPAPQIDGTNENPSAAISSRPQPWKHSSLIDLILGFSLTLACFICTIKIEIAAIVMYTLAAGFHFLAEEIFSSTPLLLAKSICMILTAILMIIDAVLLVVSLLVTELLGGVAFALCTLFGGPTSGVLWHQFIRRACHMTRWGFRSCHKGWKPERVFPISMEDERLQFHQPLQLDENAEDTENQGGCQYSDVPPPPRTPNSARVISDDLSTLTDTARYTHASTPDEPPPPSLPEDPLSPPQEATLVGPETIAMVDPENVFVLDSEEQDEEGHFIKNTQQVVIT